LRGVGKETGAAPDGLRREVAGGESERAAAAPSRRRDDDDRRAARLELVKLVGRIRIRDAQLPEQARADGP